MNFLRKLWQCFFCWKVKPGSQIEIRSADVLLVQSFGLRQDSPGPSNEALAKIAENLYRPYVFPLVLQWEVADCLSGTKAGVIREHRRKGEYLDTYEVLCQSWIICQARGWKRAVVLAHPDHMWRVVKTAEKLGFKTVAADVSSTPYDKESIQWWTRNRALFIAREIPTRVYYLLRGWV